MATLSGLCVACAAAAARAAPTGLVKLLDVSLGQPVMQVRARPLRLGGSGRGFLVAYCADFDVDPYTEMFFFPRDTLKLVAFTEKGERLWQRDLGRAVVPGMHFCPVQAFDLDADGIDEVWFVNNVNEQHPLGVSGYRLERLDGRTGKTTGQWPWPANNTNQSLSHTFRNFIVGGRVRGEPVLVTAQGTYADMYLQGWRPDLTRRWVAMAIRIGKKTSGPDGRFHQNCDEFLFDAVTGEELKLPYKVYGTRPVDLDGDGYDELVYGIPGQDGRVIDRQGRELGSVGGPVALSGPFLSHPGEQLLAYREDGTLTAWGMATTPAAGAR